jgi:hypothetical protein
LSLRGKLKRRMRSQYCRRPWFNIVQPSMRGIPNFGVRQALQLTSRKESADADQEKGNKEDEKGKIVVRSIC